MGQAVIARATRWRLRSVRSYARGGIADLDPLGWPDRDACALLVPFDRLVPSDDGRAIPRRTSLHAAARALATAALEGSPFEGTQRSAALQVWPWQLEAARLVQAGATRVLLADAVGLGKTVQAGLVCAWLRAHDPDLRVLVLTPAGVRRQWIEEWHETLGLHATGIDPGWLRRTRRDTAPHVNPWTLPPIAIASIDFVKQADVTVACSSAPWHVLIVDEAHHAAPGTDRREAVERLASTSQVVLLITATPHDGDDQAYRALCAIGRTRGEPPIAIVRRTAAEVGLGTMRRRHTHPVPPLPDEQRLLADLREYASRVWTSGPAAARLVAVVLLKRAASSFEALYRSLDARHRALSGFPAPDAVQPVLPFDGEQDDGDAAWVPCLAVPGLSSLGDELSAVARLRARARLCAAADSKIACLVRLLARAAEPALVFTEYRDTAVCMARALCSRGPVSLMHGGLSVADREAARNAFTSGRTRVLVATDVAGEGLNFQHATRLLVNVECPWTPVRLEQRIGRVDRLGQTRRVHAITLVRRDRVEQIVWERLEARRARIEASLAPSVDRRVVDDLAHAAAALGVAAPAEPTSEVPHPAAVDAASWPQAAWDDDTLCGVLALDRAAARGRRGRSRSAPAQSSYLRLRPAVPGALTRRGVALAFRVARTTRRDTTASVAIVGVFVELHAQAFTDLSERRLAALAIERALPVARQLAPRALDAGDRAYRCRARSTAVRLRALLQAIEARSRAGGVQPGLFDRRAIAEAARRSAGWSDRARDLRARLRRMDVALDRTDRSIRVAPALAVIVR